ncbi:MAG: L,D-transpeptidase family protein [Bacteroidota bacterium]
MKSSGLLAQLKGICLTIVFVVSIFTIAPMGGMAKSRCVDTGLAAEIQSLLNNHKLWLNYPLSTKRFYQQQRYAPQWLTSAAQDKTWKSMLLLDCVLQFGLSYNDYRYNEHLPSTLHDVFEKPGGVSLAQQARFEIMLTDDMITFVNQLHFGVLNPSFTPGIIDSSETGFRAEDVLQGALKQQKVLSFLSAVQPKCNEYVRLQEYLASSLLYMEDCYELPEGDLQNVAMNMERLRWAGIDEERYLMVNIPSFNLTYYKAGTVNEFKVVVGSPSTPTPQLYSAIKFLTTTPDRKIPAREFLTQVLAKAVKDISYLQHNQLSIYDKGGSLVKADQNTLRSIIRQPAGYYARQSVGCDNASGSVEFNFSNVYELSMHGTPDTTVFERESRALSKGGISVQHADSLAVLLLFDDGAPQKVNELRDAIISNRKKIFRLTKSLPLKVVYVTSDVVSGRLVRYNDIYDLDKSLQSVMFPAARPLSMR